MFAQGSSWIWGIIVGAFFSDGPRHKPVLLDDNGDPFELRFTPITMPPTAATAPSPRDFGVDKTLEDRELVPAPAWSFPYASSGFADIDGPFLLEDELQSESHFIPSSGSAPTMADVTGSGQ